MRPHATTILLGGRENRQKNHVAVPSVRVAVRLRSLTQQKNPSNMARYGTSSSVIGSHYGGASAIATPLGFSALPARQATSDPQTALIHALASPRGSPSRPSTASTTATQGDLLMMAKAKRQASKASAAPSVPVGPPCDRCDGNHRTANCPYFKGGRDNHEDATDGIGKGGVAAEDAPPVIVQASVVSQPGDGSCLFHSLGYFLKCSHQQLRTLVATFIEGNPDANIAGSPLRKWVLWDSGIDVRSYANRMRTAGSWGGALEMAIIAEVKKVAVHVYERHGGGQFKQIATFGEVEGVEPATSAHVVYGGRVHYDALQLAKSRY